MKTIRKAVMIDESEYPEIINTIESRRKVINYARHGVAVHLPATYCLAKGLKAGDVVKINVEIIEKKQDVGDEQ